MKTIVNGLWLGDPKLKHLEILTLKSFTSHGHEFHLWHYFPITSKLPSGVVLRDGRELIPEDNIFRYPQKMMLGFGGGSFVGFSEIFRYKLLRDIGGWYSDMDITCLKSLDLIENDYFFRNHGVLSVVGNIMKVPKNSELMNRCYEIATKEVNAEQNDWHHAIRILCYHIENLNLQQFISKTACNLDRFDMLWPFIHESHSLDIIPSSWHFIHWMNSVNNKSYKIGSVYEQLLVKYKANEPRIFF